MKRYFLLFVIFCAVIIPGWAQLQSVPKRIDGLLSKPGLFLPKSDIETIFEFKPGYLKDNSFRIIKPDISEQLNIAVAESRFLQIDGNGNVSAVVGKASSKTKKIQVYIDFGRYKIYKNDKGEIQKIGYLLRLESEITNFSADADMSSVFAVGFAAKIGKIQGRVKVTTIGLAGDAIDQYVTTATSISEESLLKAIENLAILKSKIYTDEIIINPDRLPDDI